jgi:hypothetical protein
VERASNAVESPAEILRHASTLDALREVQKPQRKVAYSSAQLHPTSSSGIGKDADTEEEANHLKRASRRSVSTESGVSDSDSAEHGAKAMKDSDKEIAGTEHPHAGREGRPVGARAAALVSEFVQASIEASDRTQKQMNGVSKWSKQKLAKKWIENTLSKLPTINETKADGQSSADGDDNDDDNDDVK